MDAGRELLLRPPPEALRDIGTISPSEPLRGGKKGLDVAELLIIDFAVISEDSESWGTST